MRHWCILNSLTLFTFSPSTWVITTSHQPDTKSPQFSASFYSLSSPTKHILTANPRMQISHTWHRNVNRKINHIVWNKVFHLVEQLFQINKPEMSSKIEAIKQSAVSLSVFTHLHIFLPTFFIFSMYIFGKNEANLKCVCGVWPLLGPYTLTRVFSVDVNINYYCSHFCQRRRDYFTVRWRPNSI